MNQSLADESRRTKQAATLLGSRFARLRAEAASTRAETARAISVSRRMWLRVPPNREAVPELRGERNKAQSKRALEARAGAADSARGNGEPIPIDPNEIRHRTYSALDQNRNLRQISILLTYRGIKLVEESQLLLKQSLEWHASILANWQHLVTQSFAMLSRGRKLDSNEPY